MEPFNDLGTYWLPGEDENSRAGELSYGYESDGIHLALASPFESHLDFMSRAQDHPGYPIIFGLTSSAEPITLLSAEVGPFSMSMGGFTAVNVKLQPMYIFRGAHLTDGLETLFKGFQVHFDHMEGWADPGHRVLEPVKDSNGTQYEVTERRPISGRALGGTVSVEYATSHQVGVKNALFERSAYFEFEADESTTLTPLLRSASVPLQYLLTFGCGFAVHPTHLSVRVEGDGQQFGNTWRPTWIEVAYRGWHAPTQTETPPLFTMRLPLIAFRDRFEEILQAWEQLYQEQERAMINLFAISLGLDLYVDTRFLFAVQAVELYHRKRWSEGVLPNADHKQRIADILASVEDPAEKKWLKEKLAWSNEPTLRQRLERMQEVAGDESARVLREQFAKAAADTRNYLTHYDERLKDKAAEGEDLYLLGLEVIALLDLCLLRDLGFDGAMALRLSAQTSVFRNLLGRKGESVRPWFPSDTNASDDVGDESDHAG